MRDEKTGLFSAPKRTGKASRVGAWAACALALVFALMSIVNVNRLNSSLSVLYDHPYQVTSHLNALTNSLSIMQVRMGRLLSYSAPEDYAIARESIQELLPGAEEDLSYVEENYLGDPEDALRLREAFDQMLEMQGQILAPPYDAGPDELYQQIMEELSPVYQQVLAAGDKITATTDWTIRDLSRTSRQVTFFNTAAAVVLVVAIVAVTAIFQRSVQRKNRELLYKEHLFLMLTENIDDVVCIYDVGSGGCEFVSGNAERVLGTAAEDMLREMSACTDEESVRAVTGPFQGEVLQKSVQREYRIVNPATRQTQWMLMQIYPVRLNGQVEKYIIKLVDQTQQRASRQALEDALASAQQANGAKRDFLSRMSHEIRTPMNAIIGMTAIAAAAEGDREKVADCLRKITYSSKHLLSIINDVLDMSAIESGKISIAHEQFDLGRQLTSLAALYDSQCRQRGVSFELTCDLTEEELVGDQMRLNQILYNLLSNAVKFTPAGGSVTLDVRQLALRDGKAHLSFAVSDTGIGIAPEALERLFQPFEQAEASTARKYGGTGLGLAITKNLTTLMDGTIRVESAPRKGSTFTVELPFGLLEERAKASFPEGLDSLRVLVTDDDRGTCEHAVLLLERIGMEARWVLSGAEAVTLVEQAHRSGEDFNVCLIDWKMPGMDGVETTRRIREQVGPDTLIIIISAYDWSEIETQARAAGANAFLSKPMLPSTLYNTILNATGRPAVRAVPSAKSYDFKGRSILVAEDNELNMEIARELLRATGATVVEAVNGRQAVELFQASAPGTFDAVLLDVQMPVMDGHQAAHAIRALERADAGTVPIFAMTANAFAEDVASAKAAGMNEHVAKPINVEELYGLLAVYFTADAQEG